MNIAWELQYEWIVQGLYSSEYGWEDVYAGETRADAKERLKEYKKNEPLFRFRVIKRKKEV